MVDGSVIGSNKATGQWSATGETTYTWGGAADLWGLTLTPAQVNAATFGIALAGTPTFGSVTRLQADWLRIVVHCQ